MWVIESSINNGGRFFELKDWLRPSCVYAVQYTMHYPCTWDAPTVYFRTEKAAMKYMENEVMCDAGLYNGAASQKLLKLNYHTKKNKAMKKFNLERALAGNPVVTRDGREVTEIVLLKTTKDGNKIVAVVNGAVRVYNIDGDRVPYSGAALDLFMAPVKKTGYVNLYKNSAGIVYCGVRIYGSVEAAVEHIMTASGHVATIPIGWEE